jgi:hypothetical protein
MSFRLQVPSSKFGAKVQIATLVILVKAGYGGLLENTVPAVPNLKLGT